MSTKKIIGFALLILALIPVGVWVMQMLWNYVMPDLFGIPEITFLQMGALWLLVTGLIGTGASS